MVGSQMVPYIYEDYVTVETAAKGIYKMSQLDKDEKLALRSKVKNYVQSEFSYQKTIDDWHTTMKDTIENWKNRNSRWEVKEI